jgi:Na+/H+ antiporter NhaD/arsenite permease-like protein
MPRQEFRHWSDAMIVLSTSTRRRWTMDENRENHVQAPPGATRRSDILWIAAAACLVAFGLLAARFGLAAALDGFESASFKTAIAVLIFLATYTVMALGKLPGYHLDRAGAALLGASLMVGTGVVSPEEAFHAVDINTMALLLGMMIVVANLRISGFFWLVTAWVMARARHPFVLLSGIVLVAGLASAFLVNDTICLVMTPLVLDLVLRLKRDPIPYLLALAMGSNIGSVATITGNPQNMIVGSLSGIPYGAFAGTLAPVAAIGLVLTITLITFVFRREFLTREQLASRTETPRYHRPLVFKSVFVTAAMILLFFLGKPVAQVALLGGGLLLVTRRVKPEKVYREID